MRRLNKVHSIFFIIYFLVGLYIAWITRGIIYPDIGRLLIYGLISLPLILTLIGIVFFIAKKNLIIPLWTCSLYWIAHSVSELIEDNNSKPNNFIVISMLITSIACMVILVFEKKKISKV